MEQVVQTFRSFDKTGDGLISYDELALLLESVDPGMTADKFKILMQETGASSKDRMKFEEFAAWLNGDGDAPKVVRDGAQGETTCKATHERPPEEDESDVEMEEEEELELDIADLEDVDLDLNKRITRKEWIFIMRELDVDKAEANELFDNITEDAVKEGLGTPEEGFPLREFLEELKVEVEDMEALKLIAQAAKTAKEKLEKGEEEPPEEAIDPRQVKLAVDKVVRELDREKRPAEDAWAVFEEGKVPLSKVQRGVMSSFESKKGELVEKAKAFMISPPLVSSIAGQNACRELCTAEVAKIVAACKAEGKQFTDPEWDMTSSPDTVLYVDKAKPGWDCTVAKPAGYKRLTEIVQDPQLFKGGIRPGDIVQGQIGTCFLLGAMGAMVSKDPKVIRKLFITHDVQTGVYGVRFCLDGEWTYVIVDDWMPVDEYGRLLYAHSRDPQEVWCPLLEKAYCKLHTCYEMCDGGLSTEAIFNFFGGVSGSIEIKDSHRKDPVSYWKLIKQSRSKGWLLTVHFAPKTGASGGQGKCGEATFESGLVGGHCYSVLRAVEAHGNHLICCRNPWGTGEWKGKWSDKNAEGEWTPEMKEATGYTGSNDGKFWMSVADFIENVGGVSYARPFGPNWNKMTQYKSFLQGAMKATAKYTYAARADDELSLEKGKAIEVLALAAGWWYGKSSDDDTKKGYFPGNYVRLNDRPVARFDLVGTKKAGVEGNMTMVVMLMQPASTRQRKFYQRKQDGLNYKDTSYPLIKLCVVSPDGKIKTQKQCRKRCVWAELNVPGGAGWRIYAYAVDGLGGAFTLRVYTKDDTAMLTEVPGASISELQAAIAAG